MTGQSLVTAAPIVHGGARLPAVTVDCYNVETRDEDGFVGDRASKKAFRAMVNELREPLRRDGDDPLGDKPTDELGWKKLDELLTEGNAEAAGVIHGAIEAFAKELAQVIRRFLKLKGWRDTERVVIGGGLSGSRVGEVAIGRTAVLLKTNDIDVELARIHNDPDEAGLIGSAHLAPSWIFKGHQAILAVDVGGTNIRAGIIDLNLKKAEDLSKAEVWKLELWRHANDKLGRDEAIRKLVGMLEKLIARADRDDVDIAPFIGIGCPGLIDEDGTFDRGVQNLPGNWAGDGFHFPSALREAIPEINGHETMVLIHNDAVVQGLSEVPFMRDVKHWGALTIGTGLGNARFTNRTNGSE
ncbi:MAG TPA: ROK family protein [Pseudolabrys sp.]|nr:ROK family protein [Pseudolabrys sp.]